MTAHKDVGTLAEIGAKVGDVVQWVNGGKHLTVDQWRLDRWREEYRIISRAAPDYMDGNWHEWAGGECPVPGDTTIEVILADEPEYRGSDKAAEYDWVGEKPWSITRFRVIRDVDAPSVSSAPSPHETPTCPLYGPYTARETLFMILGAHSASPFLPGWIEAQIRDTVGRAV